MGIRRFPIILCQIIRICRAGTTQVAYDYGYMKPLSYTKIPAWNNTINEFIDCGSDCISCILSSNYIDSIEYVQQLETKFPCYLHTLYCYSSKAVGCKCKATFDSLALCMHKMSATPGESKMNLCLGQK